MQKTDGFVKHLEELFQPNQGKELPTWEIKKKTDEIKTNIDPKKAHVFDLIIGDILRKLLKIAIMKLTYLIDASLRLWYVFKKHDDP